MKIAHICAARVQFRVYRSKPSTSEYTKKFKYLIKSPSRMSSPGVKVYEQIEAHTRRVNIENVKRYHPNGHRGRAGGGGRSALARPGRHSNLPSVS